MKKEAYPHPSLALMFAGGFVGAAGAFVFYVILDQLSKRIPFLAMPALMAASSTATSAQLPKLPGSQP